MRYRLLALLLPLVWLALTAAASAQCPATNATPGFSGGGTAWGASSAQMNVYFGAKVDANNGTICNPNIVGGTVPGTTLGPGLTAALGSFNAGNQQATNNTIVYPQLFPRQKTGSYTVNSDNGNISDSGALLIAHGSGVVFTAPNPASSNIGVTYNFASDGTNGYTITTVSAASLFYGCPGGGGTSLVVSADFAVTITNDGSNYVCRSGTTSTLGAGLTSTIGTRNTGNQVASVIYPQLFPVGKSSSYVVNADHGGTSDSGALLVANAAITFTAPNPNPATAGLSYHFSSDGTHTYSVTTSGGTALIYGCPGAGSGVTTYSAPVNAAINITSDGSNYACQISAGNVTGPNSSGNGYFAFYSGTGGNAIQDTGNLLSLTQDSLTSSAKLEIQKMNSPGNYTGTHAAYVLQQTDGLAGAINSLYPSVVFDMHSTGNGVVTAGSHLSQTIWMGVQGSFTKSGDGSGQSFTAIGNLDAVGSGGYNEICGFCATESNRASVNGTVAGAEIYVADSADGGVTTPGPTQLSTYNARIAKWNTDRSRPSQTFYISSEGAVAPDNIMAINPGFGTFVQGINLYGATFTSGNAILLPNNTNLAWVDTGLNVSAEMFLDSSNVLELGYGESGGATPNDVQIDGRLIAAHSSGFTIDMITASPMIRWDATGQATDNKLWTQFVNGTTMHAGITNDANSIETDWLGVTRSGTSITQISLTGQMFLSGNATIAAGNSKHFLCVDPSTHQVYEGTGVSCN